MNDLAVGGAKAENVPGVVMDHPTVEAISRAFETKAGKIEGIVGFPFFARFATTVDYQKKELTLVPNGYKPGDFLQDMVASLMKATSGEREPGTPRRRGARTRPRRGRGPPHRRAQRTPPRFARTGPRNARAR